MSASLKPAMALDPEAIASCYRGGLALESAPDRLAASYVVLLAGRLGLTPGEFQHLHEGWVDWERGELQIPAVDSCACELCWESARVAQRDGDPRPLAEIVADHRWAGTPRTVSFGWSPRLTGVIATALDSWDYFDRSAEEVRTLLVASADRTGELEGVADVDPSAVDVGSLRAAAATFFADAGFDAPRVADAMGIDVETAAAFTAQTPGRARIHLYRTFDAEPPVAADDGESYPLLADPDPLEAEPFDPTDFDAAWREDRAAEAGDPPDGSPRPAVVPAGDDVETDDEGGGPARGHDTTGERPPESTDPGQAGAAGSSDGSADAAATDEVERLVTQPVKLVMHTRFASPSMLNGRPCGGRLLIGQSELCLAAHGGGEIQAAEVVAFSDVRDVAFEWAPDRLAEMFETTVGIASRVDGERRTAVIELPDGERRDFAATLFEGLLDRVTAVVKHPATVGGRVTDAEQKRCVASVTDGLLEFAPSPGAEPEATIALEDVIGVERDAGHLHGGITQGLTIEHLQPGSKPVKTAVAAVSDRDRALLERYVVSDHRRRERAAADATLQGPEQEVIDALHAAGGERDLVKLLGMDRDALSALVEDLAAAGFVHESLDGVRLTGMGQLCADEVLQNQDA